MFLISRLPQVNENVLRFQICGYVVWIINIFNATTSFVKVPIFGNYYISCLQTTFKYNLGIYI